MNKYSMEIITKRGEPGKKSHLIPRKDERQIVCRKECSLETKIPNTQNSLLIK